MVKVGLNIRILSGKRKGEEFKLRAGITIGRKSADLLIRDGKMSSLHAAISEKEGQLILVDQGSRNKIVSEGTSHEELLLEDGVRFVLGDTEFEIFYVQTGDIWEEKLGDYLKQLERVVRNHPAKVHPFFQKVELKVLGGPDRGKVYPLGYGPRSAGKDGLDLFFQEHFEKAELFVIEEKGNELRLKTKHPDLFTINDVPADTEVTLTNGDIVIFGKTHIQVAIEK